MVVQCAPYQWTCAEENKILVVCFSQWTTTHQLEKCYDGRYHIWGLQWLPSSTAWAEERITPQQSHTKILQWFSKGSGIEGGLWRVLVDSFWPCIEDDLGLAGDKWNHFAQVYEIIRLVMIQRSFHLLEIAISCTAMLKWLLLRNGSELRQQYFRGFVLCLWYLCLLHIA